MTIELPPLPYAFDALAPHISAETLEYHYGRQHRGYVEKLNALIAGTPFAGLVLEDIVKSSSGTIFNNAAQVWNHTFYWRSLRPGGGGGPAAKLAAAIAAQFGTIEQLRDAFVGCAMAHFGSGWAWLVKHRVDDSLAIVCTGNAETPLTESTLVPVFVVDVWEHAYYIDYRNARAGYLDACWQLINWDFASANYAR
jgi:Fe-Mn family superoxide dismutase